MSFSSSSPRWGRVVVVTVAGATALASGGLSTSSLADAASPAPAAAAKPPVLSAQARANGLSAKYGAVPGWRNRHLKAASTISAPTLSAASTALTGTRGIDVSSWSGSVNWNSFRQAGVRFTYVKASEGTYYTSGTRATQMAGARQAGMYVGGYHFANPSQSSGAAQADYFVNHGGGWTPGTLPGVVDLEWNPYSGNSCYNMSRAAMRTWIFSFQLEYLHQTGTWPVVYTARPWWNQCVGDTVSTSVIGARSDLWVSTPSTTLGAMPYGWSNQRIWQYAYSSAGYDYDRFNGTLSMLKGMTIAGR